MATSSSSLREQRSVHPTVAHTVDSLLLQERTKWAIHINDGLTQSVTSALLELQGLQHRIRTEPETVVPRSGPPSLTSHALARPA